MLKCPEINWNIDGTPESSAFGDIYFSKENGLEESSYVFLQGNNLPEAWKARELFTIAELGFGTGLNFLNTVRLWLEKKPKNSNLHYISFEKFPLNAKTISKAISVWPELSNLAEELTISLPDLLPGFHRIVFKKWNVYLTLCYGDANLLLPQLEAMVDAWYLDGFAPSKNPEMWSEEIFNQIKLKSNKGATLATFSAARIVKDGLSDFEISLRKGYGRKRDMLIAKLPGKVFEEVKQKNVAIVGAGLAGSLTAYALSLRGYNCTIFEKASDYATVASGAAAGVSMPYLVKNLDQRSEFFLNSFGFSWRQILGESFFLRSGVIRLAQGTTQEKVYANFDSFNFEPCFAMALSSSEISDLLKLKVKKEGFYFPTAGWISPKKYSYFGLENSKLILNTEVKRIEKLQNSQLLFDAGNQFLGEFTYIVFANAFSAKEFYPNLPITVNRGQLIQVKSTSELSRLKHVLCHEGYIMPESNGEHLIGASYDHKSLSFEEDKEQTKELLKKTYRNLPDIFNLEVTGYKVGLRTTTQSRMPIVKQVDNNIFLNIAHGSRGLVSCPISGEVIAGMINLEPLACGKNVFNELQN